MNEKLLSLLIGPYSKAIRKEIRNLSQYFRDDIVGVTNSLGMIDKVPRALVGLYEISDDMDNGIMLLKRWKDQD